MNPISIILIAALVVVIVEVVFDKDGRFMQWLWCRKHGLSLREEVTALGGGAILWWGEDADGNQYIPGADEKPFKINKETKK